VDVPAGEHALGVTPVSTHDYLRTLAISRLVLDNVPNIWASWVTQGADIGSSSSPHFGARSIWAHDDRGELSSVAARLRLPTSP
jgi:2-iminoacetate synthase ThiH